MTQSHHSWYVCQRDNCLLGGAFHFATVHDLKGGRRETMRIGWLAGALAMSITLGVAGLSPAAARGGACDEDTIQSVSRDGSILVMLSGAVYRVSNLDRIDSMLWLPSDDVLVCGNKIINTDEDGEKVEVTRLR
jgi:hypothetical protein